jgi:uncharacterized surface protein with fasciclin (FAS1) repeats
MKIPALACAALLASALPARAAPPAASRSLVETAVADGRFTTLVAALKAADLVGALSGPGPFTVFAPLDDAFAALPKGAVAALLEPANKARLQRVLTHHVVQGRVLAADLLPKAAATTLAGTSLPFTLRVGDARVVIADILCSNGVIHVVDRVLLPPEAPPAPAVSAVDSIRSALSRGVPMFNAGDHAGCAAVYERTAREILDAGAAGELSAMDLAAALSAHSDVPADRAWAFRRAFDRLVDDEAFRPRIEAELPAGFPAAGPVGRVVRKTYPGYRAARAEGGEGAFWTLFQHIQRNEVKMTAPVEMTLGEGMQPRDMAFLYPQPGEGQSGRQGAVDVLDLPARTVLSIGMRGDRSDAAVSRAKAALESRLAKDGLRRSGPFRLLGYNSPMVPASERFWEMQIALDLGSP